MLQQLAERTNGDLYIGVVGPVRVGKSTFVKKVMELLVLPNIVEDEMKMRALDELPQSSPGPVIMTSEPKFVPANAAQILVGDNPFPVNIRLVDCVGYVIDGAKGYEDENGPKLVHTPWHHEPIAFQEAAKIGTDKVIRDHATLGIVVTTDGTVNNISRKAAQSAEQEIIAQLQQIGKPFVIVVNSAIPASEQAIQLRNELFAHYNVPVLLTAINQLSVRDVQMIMNEALYEFPLEQIEVLRPDWLDVLAQDDPLHVTLSTHIAKQAEQQMKIRDLQQAVEHYEELAFVERCEIENVDAGLGIATLKLVFAPNVYKEVCAQFLEEPLETKKDWLLFMKEANEAKKAHSRFQQAINDAQHNGYGITLPTLHEFEPAPPELIKENNFFGVRLTVAAPSYHIIRVDMEAEFAPLIGSEFHSEHLLKELTRAYENDHDALWQTQLFGTPLHEVLKESIRFKMNRVPETARKRMRQTIERMVNEQDRGLVTFIL